jgi:glycine cleavage system H protein
MTVLLVLFALLFFLAADYFVQRSRTARQVRLAGAGIAVAAEGNPRFPEDAELVSNHMWMRRDSRGNTVIGVDELLARALGAVEQVLLPDIGSLVTPAAAHMSLAARGCSLDLASPVSGHVVELNTAVVDNPALANDDPYGVGWFMKIRPVDEHAGMHSAYRVSRPAEWLRSQHEQMKEFFLRASAPGVPVMVQDGGQAVEGILQQFDAGVWDSFAGMFATLRDVEPVVVARRERGS